MHQSGFDELESALRAVADDDERFGTSPAVEARLLQEVSAIARSHRASAMKVYAFAAVLVLAVAGSVWSVKRPLFETRIPNPESRLPAVTQSERTTEFFPLHYSSVPATDIQLVRLEVSRTALASFGFETGEAPVNAAAATILADVVVGSDGLARAIRFVWPPADGRREEQRQ